MPRRFFASCWQCVKTSSCGMCVNCKFMKFFVNSVALMRFFGDYAE